MKKVLVALLLTATAASANMTGFFVGAGVGTGATTAKYNDNSVNVAPAGAGGLSQSIVSPYSSDNGKSMFGARIEAGYGMTFSGCGWFGVSAYATGLNTKIDLHNDAGISSVDTARKATLRNRYNFGIEFKIGYHFTKNTVGFVGIAAEAAKYKLEWASSTATSDAAGLIAGPASQALTEKYSQSKTKLYAKPVIGFRTTGIAGNRNLFVEMKYGFGFANKITLNVPTSTKGAFNAPFTGGRKVSVRPRTHEVFLTVGWTF